MTRLTNFSKSTIIFVVLLWVYTAITWVANLVQLLRCDFDPTDKHEIIHLIGLIPPCNWVTVWF